MFEYCELDMSFPKLRLIREIFKKIGSMCQNVIDRVKIFVLIINHRHLVNL